MSDKAKRNVVRIGIPGVALLGALAVAMVLWQGQAAPARAQEAPAQQTLDAVTYSQVRVLRGRLGLTSQALAAMGLMQGQAEGVLERMLAWYEANEATWTARRQAAGSARQAWRRALRAVRDGTATAEVRESLPQLRTAVTAAEQAEQATVDAAQAHMQSALTASQLAIVNAARTAPTGAGEFALAPGLTATQLSAIARAKTRRARRSLCAADPAARDAANTAYTQAIAGILTPAQRTARANIRESPAAVQAASGGIVSLPSEWVESGEADERA